MKKINIKEEYMDYIEKGAKYPMWVYYSLAIVLIFLKLLKIF